MHFFLPAFLAVLILPPLCNCLIFQWLDARASGWNRLANLYAATQKPTGRVWKRAYICMNTRSYTGISTISISSDGLYLRLAPILRFLHAPLLIPWSKLKAMEAEAAAVVEVAAPIPVTLRLSQPAMREVIRQLGFHSVLNTQLRDRTTCSS